MKRILKFISIVVATALTVSMLSSCEKDNNDDNRDNLEDVEYGELKDGWSESDNMMIYKSDFSVYGITITNIFIFEMSGNSCSKAALVYIWPSAELAQAYYDGLGELKPYSRINKNEVTTDLTSEFKGMSKKEIKTEVQFYLDMMNDMYN